MKKAEKGSVNRFADRPLFLIFKSYGVSGVSFPNRYPPFKGGGLVPRHRHRRDAYDTFGVGLWPRQVDSRHYNQHRLEVYAPLPCARTPLQTGTKQIQNRRGTRILLRSGCTARLVLFFGKFDRLPSQRSALGRSKSPPFPRYPARSVHFVAVN